MDARITSRRGYARDPRAHTVSDRPLWVRFCSVCGLICHFTGALEQVSGLGLIPRLSAGTLQLSIRCSSDHLGPSRSFPVSAFDWPENWAASSGAAACSRVGSNCASANAADDTAAQSESVNASTWLAVHSHSQQDPEVQRKSCICYPSEMNTI